MDSAIGGSLRCGYSAGVNKSQTKTSFASKGPMARHHGKTITLPGTPTIKIVANPHVKSSITTLPLLYRSARSFIIRGLQTGGALLGKAADLTVAAAMSSVQLADRLPIGKTTVIMLGTLWTQLRVVQALDCGPDRHACDGTCFSLWHRCDSWTVCSDGSDEWNCTQAKCKELGRFRCENTKCISQTMQCDGYYDCGNGSDERDCPVSVNSFTAGTNKDEESAISSVALAATVIGAFVFVSCCYMGYRLVRIQRQVAARLSMGQLAAGSSENIPLYSRLQTDHPPTYEEVLAQLTDDAEPPPPAYDQILVPPTDAAAEPPPTYDEVVPPQQPDGNDLDWSETRV
ncbi:hypothetical protein [Endozoicomonas sp.]|uniref:hypothetical protein n=1 Tax=Endozoicomonas sp. TaxID=1892382 RepID=UPI002883E6C1|nr:hypothetical protein [Endozoicomonas sp.]